MKTPISLVAQSLIQVLAGVFSANSVTTRQVEKDVLKKTDLLGLQPQETSMLSYTGRWAFVTADVPEPTVKIVFPDAPGSRTTQGGEP